MPRSMVRPVSIQLLVPGLVTAFSEYSAACLPAATGLSRMLGPATRSDFPVASWEAALCTCMGMTYPDESAIPAACLSYLGDRGHLPESDCLLLEPVHLRTDTHGLLLFDNGRFPFTKQESTGLTAALQDYLNEYGWRVDASEFQRWYLLGEGLGMTGAAPFSQVLGNTVNQRMLRGEYRPDWQARVNEMQMLLHSSEVNLQRAREGLPAVNSVWAWGGGRLPIAANTDINGLYCDDALGRGLAHWAGIDCEGVSADAGELLENLQGRQRVLVSLSDCYAAAVYGDFDGWSQAVNALEKRWFQPLLKKLQTGRIARLELLPLDGCRYSLTRWALWRRPWKRRQPWYRLLQRA